MKQIKTTTVLYTIIIVLGCILMCFSGCKTTPNQVNIGRVIDSAAKYWKLDKIAASDTYKPKLNEFRDSIAYYTSLEK